MTTLHITSSHLAGERLAQAAMRHGYTDPFQFASNNVESWKDEVVRPNIASRTNFARDIDHLTSGLIISTDDHDVVADGDLIIVVPGHEKSDEVATFLESAKSSGASLVTLRELSLERTHR